ncbi:unnamed protein product [Cylicocyclus nassatus]|uniref:Uncharacterized protein n=1 Tax=Cylicocyclus nassatus TaxID=53992 RepID=A0AA36HCQ6_CYLNA|nr:unnamed protein product [Cylicocyclus nassatus]
MFIDGSIFTRLQHHRSYQVLKVYQKFFPGAVQKFSGKTEEGKLSEHIRLFMQSTIIRSGTTVQSLSARGKLREASRTGAQRLIGCPKKPFSRELDPCGKHANDAIGQILYW